MARRPQRALAALRWRRKFRRRRRFRIFVGSGGSRVRGGEAEEGVDLSEILDASVGHSEVSLKLGHPGAESKDFVGGAGCFESILLEWVSGWFERYFKRLRFEGAYAGRGASLARGHRVRVRVRVQGKDRGRARCEEKDVRSSR